jgi:hypothetical protein
MTMETINLDSWLEFAPEIREIRKTYELPDGSEPQRMIPIFFRGQASSEWEIETSLERKFKGRPFHTLSYLEYVHQNSDEWEKVTGARLKEKDISELRKKIANKENSFDPYLPEYGYLVHLRHYEFPSPLLDWSESSGVAAHFAFSDEKCDADQVAIYAYIEMEKDWAKTGFEGAPTVTPWGPKVRTSRRHIAQKAVYTTATVFKKEEKRHYFCPHDDIFKTRNMLQEQDILIRITLPRTEKQTALAELDARGINEDTLYPAEGDTVDQQESAEPRT